MHKLSFITYLIMPLSKKHLTKKDQKVCLPSKEIVITLPVLMFYDLILYLHFQISELPKIF